MFRPGGKLPASTLVRVAVAVAPEAPRPDLEISAGPACSPGPGPRDADARARRAGMLLRRSRTLEAAGKPGPSPEACYRSPSGAARRSRNFAAFGAVAGSEADCFAAASVPTRSSEASSSAWALKTPTKVLARSKTAGSAASMWVESATPRARSGSASPCRPRIAWIW